MDPVATPTPFAERASASQWKNEETWYFVNDPALCAKLGAAEDRHIMNIYELLFECFIYDSYSRIL